MQQAQSAKPDVRPEPGERPPGRSRRAWLAGITALAAAALAPLAGCAPDAPPPPEKGPPLAGVTLRVSCPDPAFAAALEPLARVWAARTGAAVELVATAMDPSDAADIGVIPAAELGAWADRGDLVPVPAGLRQAEAYQWHAVLAPYERRLATWGGLSLGLPLAGDGYVVVYRADRLAEGRAAAAFQKRFGRPPPAAPATWEDFAELAEVFAELDGRPSLPPLPDDDRKLADLFGRVAASFDRPAANEAVAAKLGEAALSFHHDVETGRPRLTEPGFVAAAGWLARLKGCRPPAGAAADPVAALAGDVAVLAVLSLDELARLPKENGVVPKRFGLAQLPGTRGPAGPDGKTASVGGMNYVPYFAGGRIGVVRRRCPHPDAAFDLLAELGGPARSLELVAAEGLGVGPFRSPHLNRDQLLVWYGYKFDSDRSKQLQDALRHYVGLSVGNPAYGLRGPDQAELTQALAAELRRVA
jgi:multiple sugar transport system substrate-binding protein